MTRFATTYSAPSIEETATIRDLLRTNSAQTVRGWSETYENLWLNKYDGPRAAAWINFRAAYDNGLLSEWVEATR